MPQVWLALNNLLVEPKCRAKYEMDDYRKDALYRLKRHMNEVLFDQLPVLKDLDRVLDEIAMNIGPDREQYKSSRLILEQVSALPLAGRAGGGVSLDASGRLLQAIVGCERMPLTTRLLPLLNGTAAC